MYNFLNSTFQIFIRGSKVATVASLPPFSHAALHGRDRGTLERRIKIPKLLFKKLHINYSSSNGALQNYPNLKKIGRKLREEIDFNQLLSRGAPLRFDVLPLNLNRKERNESYKGHNLVKRSFS